jgi:hypothetical protein
MPGDAKADLGYTVVPTTEAGVSAGWTTNSLATDSASQWYDQYAGTGQGQPATATSPGVSFSIALAIEVALALLGVFLAIGAIVAGRRGVRGPPAE